MAKFKNQDLLLDDNEQILLGDDDDASIYWDGSDLLINQLLKHTSQGYYATREYVQSTVANLEWQDQVLSATTDIPIGPTYGDRYIVPSGASGAWSGYDDYIATYELTWDLLAPSAGFTAWVLDEGLYRTYNGSNWIRLGGVVDHGALLGLSDDDHTQYVLVDGTRAMTGDLILGTEESVTQSITRSVKVFDNTSAGFQARDLNSDAELVAYVADTSIIFGASSNHKCYIVSNNQTAAIFWGTGTDLQGTLDARGNTNVIGGYLQVKGAEGNPGRFYLTADEGDDNADKWLFEAQNDSNLSIQSYATGSWIEIANFDNTGNLTLTGDVSAGGLYGGDHGSLTGLSDDDHTIYYHTDGRRPWSGTLTVESTGSRLEFLEDSALIGVPSNTDLMTLAPTAVTIDGDLYCDNITITGTLTGADHGNLIGLSDDDHPQYHNDTRGDARYYTQSVLNAGQLDTRYYTETEVDNLFLGLASDFLPAASDTYDIGHSDAVWDNIWCKTLHTSAGSINLGSIELTDVGGVLTTTGSISAAGGTIPASHNNDYHSETYITTSSVTYETLNGNSDVGTGSSQVAAGDHSHGVADGVWILINKTTCSNSASAGSINITGYSKIMLIWENLIPASDDDLNLTVSDDNGATWESSNYYGYVGGATHAGGAFSENMSNDSVWHITDPSYAVGTDAGEDGANGWLLLYGFNSSKKTYANGQMTWWDAGGWLYNMWGGFMYNVSTALNGLKIHYSSSNIESGTVTIYGIADS